MSAESMSEAIVLIVGLGGLLLWAFGDRLMNWVRLIWSVFVSTLGHRRAAHRRLCAAHARMVELEDEAKQCRDTLYAVRLALACDEAANGPMIATIDEALQALNAAIDDGQD